MIKKEVNLPISDAFKPTDQPLVVSALKGLSKRLKTVTVWTLPDSLFARSDCHRSVSHQPRYPLWALLSQADSVLSSLPKTGQCSSSRMGCLRTSRYCQVDWQVRQHHHLCLAIIDCLSVHLLAWNHLLALARRKSSWKLCLLASYFLSFHDGPFLEESTQGSFLMAR